MKRTILAILMAVLIATPCFAQEIETDGLFSIEGTRWGSCAIAFGTYFPFVGVGSHPRTMGFYQGTVYYCGTVDCSLVAGWSYVDLLVASVVNRYFIGTSSWEVSLGILQPIGFGIYTSFEYGPISPYRDTKVFAFTIGIMFKVDNDWSPYDQPISCFDSSGCPDDMICVDNYCQ